MIYVDSASVLYVRIRGLQQTTGVQTQEQNFFKAHLYITRFFWFFRYPPTWKYSWTRFIVCHTFLPTKSMSKFQCDLERKLVDLNGVKKCKFDKKLKITLLKSLFAFITRNGFVCALFYLLRALYVYVIVVFLMHSNTQQKWHFYIGDKLEEGD